jgi:hypothetical protein
MSAQLKEKDQPKKSTSTSRNDSFISLFTSYFWLGILLTLLAIIIDLEYPSRALPLSIFINLTESIGIAIIVASIFTFVSGTSEFINKIRALLQDIVVSRNFLGNIDSESKRDALNALIKPSFEERKIYSNIEDYLNTYISKTLEITRKCVRSNYNVNARAYIENNKVFVDSNISYRLYPTKDGYDKIKIGFLETESDSTCKKIVVNTPHGQRRVFEDLKFEPTQIDAGMARLASIDLSEYAKSCSHLDISLEMTEAGSDHWIMLSFSALMPTDGFKHTLRCENNLRIASSHTFIHGAQFYVDKPSDTEITTSCNEWIIPHTLHDNKNQKSE